MFNSKFFLWFGTKNGRRCVLGLNAFAATAISGTYWLTNTVYLDKLEEIFRMYRYGEGVPIGYKLQTLYDEVVSDMKIEEGEKKRLKPFICCTFNVIHAGSTLLPTGARIGLPVFFKYQEPADVDRTIKAFDKGIDWESPEGEKLRHSLVLSNKAVKYGIAREILEAKNVATFVFPTLPAFYIALNYGVLRSHGKSLRIVKKTPLIRIMFYTLYTTFVTFFYLLMTDFINFKVEKDADIQAAKLSEDYLEGAIEYYDKWLERNQCLRHFLEKGEQSYTKEGEFSTWFRVYQVPLLHRREYLMNLKSGTEEKSEWSKLSGIWEEFKNATSTR